MGAAFATGAAVTPLCHVLAPRLPPWGTVLMLEIARGYWGLCLCFLGGGLIVLEDVQLLVGMLPWHPLPTLGSHPGKALQERWEESGHPLAQLGSPRCRSSRAETLPCQDPRGGGRGCGSSLPSPGCSHCLGACCDVGTSPPWLGVPQPLAAPPHGPRHGRTPAQPSDGGWRGCRRALSPLQFGMCSAS